MPSLPSQPHLGALQIRNFVGSDTYQRGIEYAAHKRVLENIWDPQQRQLRGKVTGNAEAPYSVIVTFTKGEYPEPAISACSCPVRQRCKHVAALLLAYVVIPQETVVDVAQVKAPPPWQRKIAALLEDNDAQAAPSPLGVQFELVETNKNRKKSPVMLGLRPVTLNDKGRWVYGGLKWGAFRTAEDRGYYYAYDHQSEDFSEEQNQWMKDFYTLQQSGYADTIIYLEHFGSPLLWDMLGKAKDSGIILRSAGKSQKLDFHQPVTLGIDALDNDGKIRLQPAVTGASLPPDAQLHIIGSPGHGLLWYDGDEDLALRERALHLAPAAEPFSPVAARLLAAGKPVDIPRNGRTDFLESFAPELVRRAAVASPDGSVQLPAHEPPRLRLTATHFRQKALRKHPDVHGIRLSWTWDYTLNGNITSAPLPADAQSFREPDTEAAILHEVAAALKDFPAAWEASFPRPLLSIPGSIEAVELHDVAGARFAADALPLLAALDRVTVIEEGDALDYVELTEAPEIKVTASDTDSTDWFDLGVTVTLGGTEVPFDQLFMALAHGEEFLMLENGNYFSLQWTEYQQLRRLIEEARSLQDRDSTTLSISRHQATLWEDLAELATTAEQSESWKDSVSGLLDISSVPRAEVPATLDATLRPYQQAGFEWLAFLHDNGLGGVLADDMGLGKTVQALALICHAHDTARAQGRTQLPYLVIAPTSVVPNWASETKRFAPHLRVSAMTETLSRNDTDLAALLAETDIVIASYGLFRLDFEEYNKADWAGLILDEAQFVKNPATIASKQARTFRAPFKLAITGTPMENNLMELWSLFSIASPGLFPNAKNFEELYRKPIEKEGDKARLAQLRRRIKPLIMRRTKEVVATDLPPKQEQVLELTLSPKHRVIYQRHLQRERQKVLGMLEDLDKNRFTIFRSLTMLRQLALDPSLVDEAYAGVPSSKLDALMEQLEDLVAEDHRALIFSQFTSFLGKAAERLDAAGIEYAYLDGSTTNRGKVIDSFREGTAPVFLISLKAGGFGLNLTEADYCFLLDPWWNPASENQAVDRAHRIGQTKNVMVYRLVAKDTIEEKVMALKEKKARLFASVMDDDAEFGSALSVDDVRGLFED